MLKCMNTFIVSDSISTKLFVEEHYENTSKIM